MAATDPLGQDNVKIQRHPRSTVLSFGFALVTAAAFSAALVVPSVTQAQQPRATYPKRIAIHTQPQDGWNVPTPTFNAALSVAPSQQLLQSCAVRPSKTVRDGGVSGVIATEFPDVWDVTKFQNVWGEQVAARVGAKFRAPMLSQGFGTDGSGPAGDTWSAEKFQAPLFELPYTRKRSGFIGDFSTAHFALGWLYATLPVADIWSAEKFQNVIGDCTPRATKLSFRYPLLSQGFSTDGSSPAADVWSAEKFQEQTWDYPVKLRQFDVRLDFQPFRFGLLDARPVMPAIQQLTDCVRTPERQMRALVTPDSFGWIYTNLPAPFDPRFLVHSMMPSRMGNRRELSLHRGVFYYDMAWLHDVLGLVDTPLVIVSDVFRPTFRPRRR